MGLSLLPNPVPVLVVGGGPSGLLQAFLLAKLNVPVLVIERYNSRLGAPKAHALCPRSLEICRQYGIPVPEIRKKGSPRKDARHVRFVASLSGKQVGSLPYERMDYQVLEDTPEMLHNIPQPDFEAYLTELLAGNKLVEIRKGVTWISRTVGNDGNIISKVQDRNSHEEYTITSQYVIACDGSRSKVRESLGIQMTGEDAYETLLTIHFNANLKPIVGDRVGMLYWIFDPAARGFIIGYDLSNTQVLIHNFDPKKWTLDQFTDEACKKIVTAAVGTDTPFDVLGKAGWILSRRVADQYRQGNVFLAGDAAHAFPPTGGLGLNSGIADVHCLASKIAAVYHGWATPVSLNHYEQERRPVALINSNQSVINGQKIFQLLRELRTEATDVDEARIEILKRLEDPVVKSHLEVLIEDQREHFDNLMLHIGYVYGAMELPKHASHFTPSYVPGARLPHAWIKLLASHPTTSQIPPVDLSYLDDVPSDFTTCRQYSTLDLVDPCNLTLIVGTGSETLSASVKQLESSLATSGIHFTTVVLDQHFGEVAEYTKNLTSKWISEFGLRNGGAVIVRSDQHILAVLKGEEIAKVGVERVLEHYGRL